MVTTMGKRTDELSPLMLIVSEARGHFLQTLEASVQHQDTKGTCLFAVVFCSTLINRFTHLRGKPRHSWRGGIAHTAKR